MTETSDEQRSLEGGEGACIVFVEDGEEFLVVNKLISG